MTNPEEQAIKNVLKKAGYPRGVQEDDATVDAVFPEASQYIHDPTPKTLKELETRLAYYRRSLVGGIMHTFLKSLKVTNELDLFGGKYYADRVGLGEDFFRSVSTLKSETNLRKLAGTETAIAEGLDTFIKKLGLLLKNEPPGVSEMLAHVERALRDGQTLDPFDFDTRHDADLADALSILGRTLALLSRAPKSGRAKRVAADLIKLKRSNDPTEVYQALHQALKKMSLWRPEARDLLSEAVSAKQYLI